MRRHEDFLQFMQKFDMTKLNEATLREAERYNEEIFEDEEGSSEWRPSPSCKILFENLPLWYLIGNTRGRNLLEAAPDESPLSSSSLSSSVKSILLLGCGDIGNVFSTLAALANSETLSGQSLPVKIDGSAGYGKGKQNEAKEDLLGGAARNSKLCLEFHLNDWNPVVLARAILFLVLAQDLNVLLSEDLDFFWSLWCHVALNPRQLKRLREVSTALAARDFCSEAGDIVIRKEEDAATLKSIWNSWAECDGIPSLERVVAMRREKITKHAQMLFMEASNKSASVDNAVKANEKQFEEICQLNAENVTEGSFVDKRDIEEMKPVVKKEALHWHRTGMSGVTDIPQSTTEYVVNPTLLDPVSWKWHMHYAANPFIGFMPLPADSLRQPMQRKAGPRIEEYPLTAACKKILRDQLISFKATTRKGGVRFYLWGGDALQLALYDLPLRRVKVEASAIPDVTLTSTSFDIIDTSNLADHVGLLNLLTCCAPLLKSPSSRLFTAAILWFAAGPSLYSYLQHALGTPHLSILPTLLGLRLAFDLQFDSLNPFPSLVNGRGASNNDERLISWCLVDDQPSDVPSSADLTISSKSDLSPSSQVRVSSNSVALISLVPAILTSPRLLQAQKDIIEKYPAPCSITAALREVAKVCCKSKDWSQEGKVMALRARCGFQNSSPLTLCLIIWNLCNRLSPSSLQGLSWEVLLGTDPLQAPAFILTLRAMWQHLRGLRGGLPHVGYAAGLGCKPGRQQGVMVYRRKLGMDYHIGMKMCQMGTPQLRVLILECPKRLPNIMERAQITIAALMGRVSSGCKIHIIDNIQLNTKTTELVISLPTDHGLNKDRVLVAIASIDGIPIGRSLPLSEYEEERVPEPVWGADRQQPFPSEIVCERGEGRSSRGLQGGMEVVCVVEYGGAFECVIGIQVGAEGAVSVEGKGEERRTQCCVVKLGRVRVEVMLPWAVDLTANVSIKVMRKRGLITCTFPKAARWPFHVSVRQKKDMQSLALVEDMPPSLALAMSAMFTMQERMFSMKHANHDSAPSIHPFYDLRKSIEVIYARHCHDKAVIFEMTKRTGSVTETEATLTILARGMKRDHLNRLVLELVYNDHKRAEAMLISGEVEGRVMLRNFDKNIDSVGAENEWGGVTRLSIFCSAQELVLYRDLLEYNGMAMVASDWQRKRVPSPDWRASFLMPLESNGADVMPGVTEDLNEISEMMEAVNFAKAVSNSPARSELPKKREDEGASAGRGTEGGKKIEVAAKPQKKKPADPVDSKIGSLQLKEDAKHDNVERGVGGEGLLAEKCEGCGKRGEEIKLKRCNACFRVAYCGSACQRAHWIQHKIDCKKA